MAKDAESSAADTVTNVVERELRDAFNKYRHFIRMYTFWFGWYADPDSDDIVSDTRQQATDWAWQQIQKLDSCRATTTTQGSTGDRTQKAAQA